MPFVLLDRLHRHAVENGDAVACADGQTALTYHALSIATAAAGRAMAERYPAGAIIVLRTSNQCGFYPWFLGSLAAAVSVMPVARSLPTTEVKELQERLGAADVLDAADVVPATSDAFETTRPPGDLLLATSGSTDRPKIVVRSAASLDAVSRNMADAVGMTRGDRVLAAVSLAHSYGLEHGLLAPLWAGASVRLIDGMDVAPLAAALDDGIDFFPAVPAMIEGLANLPHAPRGPRVAYSAGAPLPPATAERFAQRLGTRVGQIYGMTEIGSVTYNDASAIGFDANSVGLPMKDVRLNLIDDELFVQARSMLTRYFDEPLSLRDGYFPTGDLARIDAAGRLTITGRTGVLIEIAGRKVNPLEIEAVLAAHPAVAVCLVLPLRQTETVQRLRALIEPRDPSRPPSDEDLRTFARERLPPYKVPRIFETRSALPRSTTGKVLRSGDHL